MTFFRNVTECPWCKHDTGGVYNYMSCCMEALQLGVKNAG